MHRSNRIGLLLGIMFIATLFVAWFWLHQFPEPVKWWSRWCLMLYGTFAGFIVWQHGLGYSRLIQDVPTSEIATAAQGYVELFGKAAPFEDQRGQRDSGVPVLWVRKELAERTDISEARAFPFNLFYTPVAVEESQTPFSVVDKSGKACILPHGAEVIVSRKKVQHHDNQRVTEETIRAGDDLYVIGNFSSHTSSFPYEQKLEQLLSNWDRDPAVRARFDRDHDGRLNPAEWREMHLHAQMTISREQKGFADIDQRHMIYCPADGRRFVISTLAPAKLAGHYFFHMLIGLFLFFACLTVFTVMTMSRLT